MKHDREWWDTARALKAEYEADPRMSVRKLCTQRGISYGSVHEMLVAVDTEFRGRGGDTRRVHLPSLLEPAETAAPALRFKYYELTAWDKGVMRKLAAGHTTPEDLAAKFNVKVKTARRYMVRLRKTFNARDNAQLVIIARLLLPHVCREEKSGQP